MSDEDRRNLFASNLVLGPSSTTNTNNNNNHGSTTKLDKKTKGTGAGAGAIYGGKNTHPLASGYGGAPVAAASSSSSQPANSLTRRLEKLGFAQGSGLDRCVAVLSCFY